jgi:hypothetical protein
VPAVTALARPGVQTTAAAVAYLVITAVMTWPIGASLAHTVPADLGDSLLNMWIMAWAGDGLVAAVTGQMSFADLWNANIFHPTALSLTFSDHLIPQALQGLPAYLATGNILLAYNLVFLGTFALSGLGTFLLVRELTGSALAGFVAGLFYAFFPYRLNQYPHIQTLSSQWMPLALFGFRRYFDRGSAWALAGGTAAFVVQGLSSGYYLFYFAPVLAAYVVWEMAVRRRLREWRTWVAVGLAGAAAIAVTLPFLLPYAEARTRFGFTRPYGEVLGFSADLHAYLNAPYQLHFWGARLTPWPQVEGDLFPGAVPLALGAVAALLWAARGAIAVRDATAGAGPRERRVARGLVGLAVVMTIAALAVVLTGGFVWDVAGLPLRMTNVRRTLTYAVMCAVAAAVVSPRLRKVHGGERGDLTPFLVLAIAFAVLMSLGPFPRAGGRQIVGVALYDVFFTSVPGYDGLRVPARFGMIAGALLAVLCGYALAAIGRWRRGGAAALAAIALVFIAEVWAVPVPTNLTWSSSARYQPPWPTVQRVNDGPLAYRYLVAMPEDVTLLEMPFGDQGWDLRYVYYAGLHRKRIVNGYSGYFPDGYRARAARLAGLWEDRDAAWAAVTSSGATHLLIHRDAYPPLEGPAVLGWAQLAGAVPIVEFADGDVLFALPAK